MIGGGCKEKQTREKMEEMIGWRIDEHDRWRTEGKTRDKMIC